MRINTVHWHPSSKLGILLSNIPKVWYITIQKPQNKKLNSYSFPFMKRMTEAPTCISRRQPVKEEQQQSANIINRPNWQQHPKKKFACLLKEYAQSMADILICRNLKCLFSYNKKVNIMCTSIICTRIRNKRCKVSYEGAIQQSG